MTDVDLEFYQRKCSTYQIASLVSYCRRRFLCAADLININNKITKNIRRSLSDRLNVYPLSEPWERLCTRYRTERYDPHPRLSEEFADDIYLQWVQFVNYDLFPILLNEDEFTRNILRAMKDIPCNSPERAVDCLWQYFDEMTLPDSPPLWSPEDIDEIVCGNILIK